VKLFILIDLSKLISSTHHLNWANSLVLVFRDLCYQKKKTRHSNLKIKSGLSPAARLDLQIITNISFSILNKGIYSLPLCH